MTKLSSFEIANRIKEKFGSLVKLDESTYVSVLIKCRFIDDEFGEFYAIPNDLYRKDRNNHGHPKRGRKYCIRPILPIEDVKKRLFEKYGDEVTLVDKTYTCSKNKATFIDKRFGEFIVQVAAMLRGKGAHPKSKREKFEKTMLNRYGVINATQNKELALKAAKKINKPYIKYHWETSEELNCQGSWEAKVVDYLNNNKINFKWQPQIFFLPNGSSYRPDLFLIDENKWIEIKGFMRKDAQEKWNWFNSKFPNSELWNKNKLEIMGLI